MSRYTAIAAITLYFMLPALAGDGAFVFAQKMRTIDWSRSMTPLSGESSEFAQASSGGDTSMHSVVDALPHPPVDDFDELPSDFEESLTCEAEGCECCDEIAPDSGESASHGGWIVDLGASALQTDMGVSDYEAWPGDFGPAGRLTFGYEWSNGLGIRAQAWHYSMEGEVHSQSPFLFAYSNSYYYPLYVPGSLNRLLYGNYAYSRTIEISATTVYLDLFKTIHSRHGEFSVGMGPAFANLEFNFPPAGDGMQFYGGGITVFGQGYARVLRRGRWEAGMAGQTRASLLAGAWDVASPSSTAQHSEAMSILELSVGPEWRYRVGPTEDRYVFLRTVAEFQQWRSDGMGPSSSDTLALQGVSMNCGALW
jgi:hypothetical protein